MLKDWSYEMNADPLDGEQRATPEMTDVGWNRSLIKNIYILNFSNSFKGEKTAENDLIELQDIAEQVVHNLSQKIDVNKKCTKGRRKRDEVIISYFYIIYYYYLIFWISFI